MAAFYGILFGDQDDLGVAVGEGVVGEIVVVGQRQRARLEAGGTQRREEALGVADAGRGQQLPAFDACELGQRAAQRRVGQVVGVLQLEAQLLDRGVSIELTRPAAEWLGEKGYDDKMGARPLGRVIQEHIKKPLAEELLFGKLTKGGLVRVALKAGQIDLQIAEPDRPRLSGSKPPLLTAD